MVRGMLLLSVWSKNITQLRSTKNLHKISYLQSLNTTQKFAFEFAVSEVAPVMSSLTTLIIQVQLQTLGRPSAQSYKSSCTCLSTQVEEKEMPAVALTAYECLSATHSITSSKTKGSSQASAAFNAKRNPKLKTAEFSSNQERQKNDFYKGLLQCYAVLVHLNTGSQHTESQLLTSQGTQNSEQITLQNSTAFHAISFFHIKAIRTQG